MKSILVLESGARGGSKQALGRTVPGANFDPAVGVGAMCTMMAEIESPLCLGTGKSWVPHTAGVSAPGACYLMCDCNYFPKKIKVT